MKYWYRAILKRTDLNNDKDVDVLVTVQTFKSENQSARVLIVKLLTCR